MEEQYIKNQFIKSATTCSNVEKTIKWIKDRSRSVNVKISKIEFKYMQNWHFDNEGCISHKSGKFSIQGINVKSSLPIISEWQQPIIDQPEIGYLGFLVKKLMMFYILVQAKVEPGNINQIQLSPTLQATKVIMNRFIKGNHFI